MTDTTLAVQGNTGLATAGAWDDELAKYAQEASAKERLVAGKFLSVKGGALSLDGQALKGNVADVVVVGSVYENTYYEGAYDPDNKSPPVCYAFADEEKGLAPHPESAKPQAESCAACPLNKWGSARKGEGKACQNRRRLAMIAAVDLTPTSVEKAEVVYLKVPVTSTRYWAAYTKGLANMMKRPPFAVITRVACHPDPKTQIRLGFEPVGNLPSEVIPAILKVVEGQKEAIGFPYGKPEEQGEKAAEPEKPAKKGKF